MNEWVECGFCVMSELVLNARVRSVLRLSAAGATAALLAGCSSDFSRLATGPFGPADNTPTASIRSQPLMPPQTVGGASGGSFAPTPASWGSSASAPSVAIQSVPLAPPPSSPVAAAVRPVTRAVATAPAAAARTTAGSFGPWTTAGGTPVTVARGESASVVAARYGVPMDALIKANGLSSASQVTPGTSLIVPVYNAGARQASNAVSNVAASAAPAARSVQQAPQQASQKLASAADAAKQRAAAAKMNAATAARQETAKAVAPVKKQTAMVADKAQKARESAEQVRDVVQKPAVEPQRQQVAAAPATVVGSDGKPEFRWPARGRIIQGFKSGGNDGISIAVPAGTAVKAAESGVVAYAGSELKGYGNLVLIRHPNGFVSAYAHNGELNVKRGENVKRGQVIAKSGQTGNVTAPQLHFELRKGSTPVDPTQYLAGL